MPFVQVGKGEIVRYVCLLFDNRKTSSVVKNSEEGKTEVLVLLLEMMF